MKVVEKGFPWDKRHKWKTSLLPGGPARNKAFLCPYHLLTSVSRSMVSSCCRSFGRMRELTAASKDIAARFEKLGCTIAQHRLSRYCGGYRPSCPQPASDEVPARLTEAQDRFRPVDRLASEFINLIAMTKQPCAFKRAPNAQLSLNSGTNPLSQSGTVIRI